MAYGAVTRNLVKRVAELEAELEGQLASDDDLRKLAKRDSDMLLDWYEDMSFEELAAKYMLPLVRVSNTIRYIVQLDEFRFHTVNDPKSDDH